jgi:ribonuclease-3
MVGFWRAIFGKRRGDAKADPDRLLEEFQQTVGIRFSDVGLLKQALTHRSRLGGEGLSLFESNERMEFLGDSVLELVVNEYLYHHFPSSREGDLTKRKSLIVSKNILSRAARQMGLGRFLYVSDAEEGAGGRDRSSILADAFEAVIGATYLDRGLPGARRFIERYLLNGVDRILSDAQHTNYKSLLQEYVQDEFKTHPKYKITAQEGPDHEKTFTVEVAVKGAVLGRGRGHNKKEAEQDAAREALTHLDHETVPQDGTPT